MATRADGLEAMWCRRREMGRILPNGAGADTIAAVIAQFPSDERGDYDDHTRCVGSAIPHDLHGDGSVG